MKYHDLMRVVMTIKKMFASDNSSGVHPKVMEAMLLANQGHALSYGADEYTRAAEQAFRNLFGAQVETHLVFNGTGANLIGLKGLLRSYQAIFCTEESHLWRDEAGSPEQFLGAKLIPLPSHNGKLKVEDIKPYLSDLGSQHRSQPKVISVAQCTERGSIYTRSELKAICDFAKEHDFYVHVDGARIHNALAALDESCQSLFTDVGVDVVSFGGTKNGLMMAEAVVVLNPALQQNYAVIRKHGMQLASKMRFLGCQFLAYFEDNLWLKNAGHANSMARYLADRLEEVEQLQVTAKVESNLVFVEMPNHWVEPLQQQSYFHIWKANTRQGYSEGRMVMSYDLNKDDIDQFIEAALKLN